MKESIINKINVLLLELSDSGRLSQMRIGQIKNQSIEIAKEIDALLNTGNIVEERIASSYHQNYPKKMIRKNLNDMLSIVCSQMV